MHIFFSESLFLVSFGTLLSFLFLIGPKQRDICSAGLAQYILLCPLTRIEECSAFFASLRDRNYRIMSPCGVSPAVKCAYRRFRGFFMASLLNNRRISDDATTGQDLRSKLGGINKTRTRQFYCLLSSKRLILTWRRKGFSTGSASVLVCRYDWPNSVDRTPIYRAPGKQGM